jgi:hypothetical protein
MDRRAPRAILIATAYPRRRGAGGDGPFADHGNRREAKPAATVRARPFTARPGSAWAGDHRGSDCRAAVA